VFLRILQRVKVIPRLADGIPRKPKPRPLPGLHLLEVHAPVRGRHVDPETRRPNYPHVLPVFPRRGRQRGGQELGEQEVAQAVGPHLHLVALRRALVPGTVQHPGVVDEDVKFGLPVEKLLDRRLDGGQVRKVELQKPELALGLGMLLFDPLDGIVGFLLSAGQDVDRRVFGVKQAGGFLAYAGVGACYDADLACWF